MVEKKLLIIGYSVLLFITGIFNDANGQNTAGQSTFTFEKYFKNQFDWEDLNIDPQFYYDLLQAYHNNPIALNRTTAEELGNLSFLSAVQIHHFLTYRKKYGSLKSIYELPYIPHFDKQTIRILLPFVEVNGKAAVTDTVGTWTKIRFEGNHTVLMRYQGQLEKQKGFTTPSENEDVTKYRGIPGKFLTRIKSSHRRHYTLGLTLENDSGEPLEWQPRQNYYGVDHIAGHFMLKNLGGLKNIIAGDYKLHFGQGLIFGNGFMNGKGPSTIGGTRQHHSGLDGYTSTRESGFLRGFAASYDFGRFQTTAFYGNQKVDGILEIDPENDSTYFPSVRTTGYHRTNRELQGRKQIQQKTEGFNLSYATTANHFNAGFTLARTSFDHLLIPENSPYKKFAFRGKENYNAGLYTNYIWEDFHFFGELAQSKSGGMAGIGGITAYLTSYLESAWVYRNYQPDYHSFFSSSFGERSSPQNEKGLYWGIKLNPLAHTQLAAYFDTFSFPWLQFRNDAPSQGHEYFFRLQYSPHENFKSYFQMKAEQKARNVTTNFRKMDSISAGIKRQYALDLDYKPIKLPEKSLSFNTRVQWSAFQEKPGKDTKKSRGFAIMQDFQYKLQRFAFYARIGLFDTENYDTRQYVYENDVLYSFSIPAYQDTGIRNYFMAKFEITRQISLWTRVAQYRYPYQSEIGSGLETLQGNKKTTGKLQLRIKF